MPLILAMLFMAGKLVSGLVREAGRISSDTERVQRSDELAGSVDELERTLSDFYRLLGIGT